MGNFKSDLGKMFFMCEVVLLEINSFYFNLFINLFAKNQKIAPIKKLHFESKLQWY